MSVADKSSTSVTVQSVPEACSEVDLPAEEPVSAPSVTPSKDSKCERLIFALPMNDEATTFRYAVVPLPKTYFDAVVAATRVFGSFLIDPTPEHIVLRQWIKNKRDEPVWAAVDPSNWKQLVMDNDQVGIFKNRAILENFVYGKLLLSYGYRSSKNSPTDWSDVMDQWGNIHTWVLIDRPISYQDAVQTVKAKVQSNDTLSHKLGPVSSRV